MALADHITGYFLVATNADNSSQSVTIPAGTTACLLIVGHLCYASGTTQANPVLAGVSMSTVEADGTSDYIAHTQLYSCAVSTAGSQTLSWDWDNGNQDEGANMFGICLKDVDISNLTGRHSYYSSDAGGTTPAFTSAASDIVVGGACSYGGLPTVNGGGQTPISGASNDYNFNGTACFYKAGTDTTTTATASFEYGAVSAVSIPTTGGGTEYDIEPTGGSLTLTGGAAGILADKAVTAGQGSLALSGGGVDIAYDRAITPETVALALSGGDVDIEIDRAIVPETGELALVGGTVGVQHDRALTPGTGEIALNGGYAQICIDSVLSLEAGDLALAGGDVSIQTDRVLSADGGEIELSGGDVEIQTDKALSPETGSLSLAGGEVQIVYESAGIYTLVAEDGSLSLAGGDASIKTDRVLTPDTGELALSGGNVDVKRDFALIPEAGGLDMAGLAASVLFDRALSADGGVLSLHGDNVDIQHETAGVYVLTADGGAMVITGGNIGFEFEPVVTIKVIPLVTEMDGFVLVGDRIVEILRTEIAAQQAQAVANGLDPAPWEILVYRERNKPWEQWHVPGSDLTPFVNVSFSPDQKDDSGSNATTREKYDTVYDVDCFACAKSRATADGHIAGDEAAARMGQWVGSVVRQILANPLHQYLDSDLVWGRTIRSRSPFRDTAAGKSTRHIYGLRLALEVGINETVTTQPLSILGITNIQYKNKPDGLPVSEISNGA